MHILVLLMQKMVILGAKFLPEEMKLKIPKISMPSQVNVQPTDIPDSWGLRPETSAHIHNSQKQGKHCKFA